ncbi:CPBP family intramembrane glutamic endopeptidase [Streptomyces sp. NPDC085995]|uniref:CPBP family intramembrane glutamic endopeptidase n=1 Tax=Streptomyces sp. NPDC085995 TaxID=3154861 RepID=UPI003412339E
MRLVWQLLAVAAVAFIGSQAVAAVDGNPWLTLLLGLLSAVLTVPVYRWVVRRTEHRPPAELAASGAWSATVRGTLIGAAAFGAVIANIAFLGDFHIDGRGSVTGAIGLVGFMAAAAVTEELLFRGVLFRIAEERVGTWWALTATGVLFGLSHLANEHATVWGALAIAVEAGGMLTAAYVATRSLWLPIGLHFGWNFAESGVFSTEVSGNGATHGLLDSSTSGSALVTGGSFGPEASLYSVLFCVLLTAALLGLAHRRGRLLPRRNRAERAAATATLAQ